MPPSAHELWLTRSMPPPSAWLCRSASGGTPALHLAFCLGTLGQRKAHPGSLMCSSVLGHIETLNSEAYARPGVGRDLLSCSASPPEQVFCDSEWPRLAAGRRVCRA